MISINMILNIYLTTEFKSFLLFIRNIIIKISGIKGANNNTT